MNSLVYSEESYFTFVKNYIKDKLDDISSGKNVISILAELDKAELKIDKDVLSTQKVSSSEISKWLYMSNKQCITTPDIIKMISSMSKDIQHLKSFKKCLDDITNIKVIKVLDAFDEPDEARNYLTKELNHICDKYLSPTNKHKYGFHGKPNSVSRMEACQEPKQVIKDLLSFAKEYKEIQEENIKLFEEWGEGKFDSKSELHSSSKHIDNLYEYAYWTLDDRWFNSPYGDITKVLEKLTSWVERSVRDYKVSVSNEAVNIKVDGKPVDDINHIPDTQITTVSFSQELSRLGDEVHKVVSSINDSVAGTQTRINDSSIRLARLSEIEQSMREVGVSRDTIETLSRVMKSEHIMGDRGVSLESYTKLPSKNNLLVSLEATKTSKFAVIGAIVYYTYKGFELVFKLIIKGIELIAKMLDLVKKQEKNVDDEDFLQKLFNTIKWKSDNSDKDPVKKAEESFKDKKEKVKHDLSTVWTELLKDVLDSSSGYSKAVLTHFNRINFLEEEFKGLYDVVKNLPTRKQQSDELLSYVKFSVEPVLKNLDKFKTGEYDLNTLSKELSTFKTKANTLCPLDTMQYNGVIDTYLNYRVVFKSFKDVTMDKSIFKDNSLLTTLTDKIKELDNYDESIPSSLTEQDYAYIRDNLNDLFTVIAELTKSYAIIIEMYSLVSTQWCKFINVLHNYVEVEDGILNKIYDLFESTDNKKDLDYAALEAYRKYRREVKRKV